jgi:Protein of unknown function (DUF3455)
MRRIIFLTIAVCSILPLQAQQPSVDPPAGTSLLLTAAGDGSQIYTCTEGHWTLKAPDARLLDERGQVIGTHFAGPTWRLTDGSEIKGKMVASKPSPDAGSVPWLLLQAVPNSGSGQLANVRYIARTETHGGAAGDQACTSGEERISYTAKYSFYTGKP